MFHYCCVFLLMPSPVLADGLPARQGIPNDSGAKVGKKCLNSVKPGQGKLARTERAWFNSWFALSLPGNKGRQESKRTDRPDPGRLASFAADTHSNRQNTMLIRIAKKNLLFQYLLAIAVSLLVFGKAFVNHGFADGSTWLAWILHLSWALSIGWVSAKHKLSRNPGLMALIFLCADVAHAGLEYSATLWAYPLFILSYYYGLAIYGKEKAYPAIFNSAFFWSASTICFPELLFSLPCFFIILFSYSATNWRELASAVLGMGSPYIAVFAYDFLWKQDLAGEIWRQALIFGVPMLSPRFILPAILCLLCTAISILAILSQRRNLQDLDMAERHRASALTALFIYFCLFTAATRIHPGSVFPLFIPTAFFCTKFLINMKSETGKDLILYGIIALSLASCYLQPGF